jgi:anaerobic ribonucleoside-triphosphate reductase activating protein
LILNVNHILESSQVQGPGTRFTIWVQGCSIHCEQCSNKDTWEFRTDKKSIGISYTIDDLTSYIIESKSTGLTITGGEPLDQFDSTLELCKQIFKHKNIFLCSGYTYEVIKKSSMKQILETIDIICAGPFDYKQKCQSQWKGSSNQEVIYLTDRGKDLLDLPILKKEYRINKKTGEMIVTGFSI